MYKCGLVLEGGGSRAIFTSGVLDAFMENDIEFPYVIGVSAGSGNGCSYIGKSLHRYHNLVIDSANDKRYLSLNNFFTKGQLMDSEWVFNELSYDIHPLDNDTFENSKTVFCCVATNATTGKAEYFYPKSFRERGCPEIKASCSLPIVTKGCKIAGQLYYDGGLVDSIPLKRAFEDGCEKCVCILTQHRGFEKKPLNPKMTKLVKKYPNVAKAMENRHIMYNEQLKFIYEQEKNGNVMIIQPNAPLNCTSLERNQSKLESIYQLGYQHGIEAIDKIKSFI